MINIIVAGIHTGIGKTVSSAVLCQALKMDYWKPVQAGDLENSDSNFIKHHAQNTFIHEERFLLKTAASPHYAAEIDRVTISKSDFQIPFSQKGIIIESAGGLMSPLSYDLLNIDLIKHLDCPVVLVVNNYLGSINHSLLSVEVLKSQSADILGIIFNGKKNKSSEDFIRRYTSLPVLFSVPEFESMNPQTIPEFVEKNSLLSGLERFQS